MPQKVEVPGKGIIEFPDNMSPEEMSFHIQRTWPELAPKAGAKPEPHYDWTPAENAVRVGLGVGENALSMLTGRITGGVGGLAGLATMPFTGPSNSVDLMEKIKNYAYAPKTEMGQTIAKGIDWPIEKLRQMAKTVEDKRMAEHPGSQFQAVMSGLGDALPDLLMFAMEKPNFASSIKPLMKGKGISKPIFGASMEEILKTNPELAPTSTKVPLAEVPSGTDPNMFPFVGEGKTKVRGGNRGKITVAPDPFGLSKEVPPTPKTVSDILTPEGKIDNIIKKILEAKLSKEPIPSEKPITPIETTSTNVVEKPVTTIITQPIKEGIGKPFSQKVFIGSEQENSLYSMTTSMPKENGTPLPYNVKLDKPYYINSPITPEVEQVARKLKADGVISNSTGQVRPFSHLDSVREIGKAIPPTVTKPVEVLKPVEVPPLDRATLLSDSRVAREYNKVADNANPLEPDYKVADKWLESNGVKLYNENHQVGGKVGSIEDLVKESGKISPWDAIRNEKGGVELDKVKDSIYEALWKAGKYFPKIGTIGHEDLTQLQSLLSRIHSPTFLAEVDPFPLRLTDFLYNKVGLNQTDITSIIRDGSKSEIFKTVSDIAKTGGYIPEGDSFVEVLKRDQRSILGSKEGPVISSRQGAPRRIVSGGVDYEVEKKMLTEKKTHLLDQLYKGLSKEQETIVGKLLSKYEDSSKIPQEIKDMYPHEVQVMDGVRNLIFRDLWEKGNIGGKNAPKYIEGYFTQVYQDINELDTKAKENVIKAVANENGIDEVLARRILEGKHPDILSIKGHMPDQGFFGPMSKSRTLKVPLELENIRVWDKKLIEWYINGAARYIGLKKFMPIAKQGLKDLTPDTALLKSNIKGAMEEYVDVTRGIPISWDMKSPSWIRKAARVENLRQSTKLMGNAAFGLTNLTQYPLNSGIRMLSHTRPGDGLFNFARGAFKVFTEEGRRIARESGVNTDIGKGELSLGDFHGTVRKIIEILNTFAEVTEKFNKTAEVNRVWPDLIKEGMKKGLTGDALNQYALSELRYSVAKTQFFSGNADRPIAFRGPIGSTVGKFKLFTIKQLEFISNLRGSEIATFIGMNHLIGGPNALGLDMLEDELKDSKYKDSEAAKAFFKYMDAGRKGSISGVTGYDLTRKIGIGMFPGLDQPSKFWDGVIQFMNPVTRSDYQNLMIDIKEGRIATSVGELVDAVKEGNLSMKEFNMFINDLAKTKGDLGIVPIGVKRAAKYYTERQTGLSEDRFGKRIGPSEGLRSLIGYPTNEVSDARKDIATVMDARANALQERKVLEAEFVSAARLQSDRRMKTVMQQLGEYNNRYISQGVEPINPRALLSNMHSANIEKWWNQGRNIWGRSRFIELQNQRKGE